MMNPLSQLASCGQAPWLDNLTRGLVRDGGLQTLIDRDGLKGLTSNPSIFEKAIGESSEYDHSLKAFQADADHGVNEIYEHLAIADIRAATDILRPIYESSHCRDGYASLECSPYLANDTEATVQEALRLWKTVDRPNVMIKVPATPAGLPAIRQLIGQGLNINVTLLFAVPVYEAVVGAYMAGLEERLAAGGDISRIASVASFFISRIDVAVDKKLDTLADRAAADRLRGQAAIANGKLAYNRYQSLFAGPRWERLAAAGAHTQRLLWASTSTKNPAYKDTRYVEALIGRDTVDTIPPATMDAFRDHGVVEADAVERDLDAAKATLVELAGQGVSLEEVCRGLVEEGVTQFADAFDKLFAVIAQRRAALTEGDGPRFSMACGSPQLQQAFEAELEVWRKGGLIRRLWAGDKTLWTGADENRWLGWLNCAERELSGAQALEAFARTKAQACSDVVLMGMGGSSLGPEVLALTFGRQAGWPKFHILDSTDPAQLRTLEARIDLARTLFIVSSKSGGTLEPNIFLDFFFDRVAAIRSRAAAGQQFVAVTDPGSSLEKRAAELNFAQVFHGTPSIGGRYSVLSAFGLVPAAAMGLDVRRLLESARAMERTCGPDAPPRENAGVRLGVLLGVAASRFRRDKVTILTSPGVADLGAWLEQLLAESTGKHGRGLIPVAGEPLGDADGYGADRLFALIELEGEEDGGLTSAASALERAGHPVVRIRMKDVWAVGGEFFRWELATAVAGAIIGINPFDQPDVEASKDKTRALTDAYEKAQSLPREEATFRQNGVSLFADSRDAAELGRHNTLAGYLKSHFARGVAGDYAAFLAYLERNEDHSAALTQMRTTVRDRTRLATCVGFGPRFQHSTGQAYKGGPNSGLFLQITCDDPIDLKVPGHGYTFGVVKSAQARGDLEVLVERGRRTLRAHLNDVENDLPQLARALDEALS